MLFSYTKCLVNFGQYRLNTEPKVKREFESDINESLNLSLDFGFVKKNDSIRRISIPSHH